VQLLDFHRRIRVPQVLIHIGRLVLVYPMQDGFFAGREGLRTSFPWKSTQTAGFENIKDTKSCDDGLKFCCLEDSTNRWLSPARLPDFWGPVMTSFFGPERQFLLHAVRL
jgi:hypothetical protein